MVEPVQDSKIPAEAELPAAQAPIPAATNPPAGAAAAPQRPKPLTPEEQMALFEADLKENDWGHRPC